MKTIDCSEKTFLTQSLATAHEVPTITSEQRPSPPKFGIVSLLLLFTSALLLVGCGALRDRDDDSGEPATIRYVAPGDPHWSEPDRVVIERFLEQVPGIEVDRQSQEHGLSHYLSESPPPEVVMWLESHELYDVAQQNQLFDVSEIWAEHDLAEAYGRQFREVGRVNGTSRFIPIGFSWAGIYYNKEVFERYGLVPPTTWEEFGYICDTLLANGETPLSVSGQDRRVNFLWFSYLNMRLNGPSFHRHLIQGEESYKDERLTAVWETWISLFRRGYFIESPSLTSAIGSMNALIRGDVNEPLTEKKAVMALAHHFIAGELPPEFASELDFFQFPQMDPNSPAGEVTSVFGYVIPARATYHTQASAFVGYMASAEAQAMKMARVGEDPTNVGWVPLHRDVDRTLLPEAARKGEEIVRGADEILPPLSFALPVTMQAGFGSVFDWLFTKLETPETEIDVSEIQSTLEEARQQALQNGEYRQ